MNEQLAEGAWLPLTLAQLDFWEEFRLHPGAGVSTVAHAVELQGVDQPAALARAILQTIAETDAMALRLRLGRDGQPRQRVAAGARPDLRALDLADASQPRDRAFELMHHDVAAPLDLLTAPISAQWLIRLGPGHYIWYNRNHHIAVDGYAMALIEQRCAWLYTAHRCGRDSASGPKLRPLRDYLCEEASYRASSRHDADGQHWQRLLSDAPRPQVLQKGSENYPARPLAAGHDLTGLRAPLLAQAERLSLGWPDLASMLCAVWAGLRLDDGAVRREMQGKAILMPVWLPFMGRMGSVSAAIPALVVNILPLLVRLDPSRSLAQTLTELAGQLRLMRRHGRYRIEQIAADCGIGHRSRFFFSPLVNVLPFDPPQFAGCDCDRHVLSNGPGDGFNITLRGDSRADGLHLWVEADPQLTPAAGFRGLAADLPRFLARGLEPARLDQPLYRMIEP